MPAAPDAQRLPSWPRKAILSLQRTAGNQAMLRLLRPSPPATGGISVQRRRLPGSGPGDLVNLIRRLLLSGNKGLAETAITIRVQSQELDKEDIDDVAALLQTSKNTIKASAADLKDPHKGNVDAFFTGLAAFMADRRNDAVDASVAAPTGLPPTTAEVGYTQLVPGPGKTRVQVPDSDAAAVLRPTSSIRWSQVDVKASTMEGTGVGEVARLMNAGGWRGPAAEVMEFPATITLPGGVVAMPASEVGKVISKDNRRLLAANVAGLPQVPCLLRGPTDDLPADWPMDERDKAGKAIFCNNATSQFKVGAEGWKGGKPPSTDWKVLVQKGHIALNYWQLILIRISNQPAYKPTGLKIPLTGSAEPPMLKT